MSKLYPKTTVFAPRKVSHGPCFTVVGDDDGSRSNYHILAVHYPDHDQIIQEADRAVRNQTDAYGRRYHWEPPREDRGITGRLRGGAARSEAMQIILAEPAESLGKRFLLEIKNLADRMSIPAEPHRDKYATRAMLDAVEREPGEDG